MERTHPVIKITNKCFFKKGVTLTEMLIAVTITGMIILAVSSVDIMSHRFFADMQRRSAVQDEVKIAMEHMVSNVQLGTGFTINGGSQLQVKLDANGDGRFTAAPPDEIITYDLAGTTITFNGTAITDPMVTDLNFAEFTFASCSYPNEIEVTITARRDPAQAAGLDNPETTLTSSIVLRAMACN